MIWYGPCCNWGRESLPGRKRARSAKIAKHAPPTNQGYRGLTMKDKLEGPDVHLQVEQAKQLLDLGHVREALVLVMDALWQELNHLRDTLRAIQENRPPENQGTSDHDGQEEPSQSEYIWPEPKSRLLH